MEGLRKNLKDGFAKVTRTTCRKLIKEVVKVEDQYWKEDAELDDQNTLAENEINIVEHYSDAEESEC